MQFYEYYNSSNIDGVMSLMAEDCKYHDMIYLEPFDGHEEIRAYFDKVSSISDAALYDQMTHGTSVVMLLTNRGQPNCLAQAIHAEPIIYQDYTCCRQHWHATLFCIHSVCFVSITLSNCHIWDPTDVLSWRYFTWNTVHWYSQLTDVQCSSLSVSAFHFCVVWVGIWFMVWCAFSWSVLSILHPAGCLNRAARSQIPSGTYIWRWSQFRRCQMVDPTPLSMACHRIHCPL